MRSEMKALPKNVRRITTKAHGTSDWAATLRLDSEFEDSKSRQYFVKVNLQS